MDTQCSLNGSYNAACHISPELGMCQEYSKCFVWVTATIGRVHSTQCAENTQTIGLSLSRLR